MSESPSSAAPAAPRPPLSGLAVAGFVLSFPIFLGVLGIVFSAIALGQIERANGKLRGRGLAIAGLVIAIGSCVLSLLAAIAIPSFLGYMRKSKSSEAVLMLKRLERSFKYYQVEHGELPVLAAPATPTLRCCTQPGGYCAPGADFQTPPWQALDFAIDERTRFQYAFTSTKTHAEATAQADLNCDGVPITYKLVLDVQPDGSIASNVLHPTNDD